VAPNGELILYSPDLPRREGNARMLGNTLMVSAPTLETAERYARQHGWETVQTIVPGENAILLVKVTDPVVALEILKTAPAPGSPVQVTGNFRHIIYPSQNIQPTSPQPINYPYPYDSPTQTPVANPLPGFINKLFTPSDPLFSSQWHLLNTNQLTVGLAGIDIKAPQAWDSYQGKGVLVGMVDDGLQISHPDLAPNVATNSGLHYNWAGGATNNPSPVRSSDIHGTAMAGLVAARGNNKLGVCGVAPQATLVGLRLTSGSATDANEILAHRWRMDKIAVKNNSWTRDVNNGVTTVRLTSGVARAIQDAVSLGRGGLGTVFVWAAGNGAQNYRTGFFAGPRFSQDVSCYDGYPNNINVIAVGAVDVKGVKSYYTERGANVAISAPSSRYIDQGSGNLGLISTDLVGTEGFDPTDYTVTTTVGGTSSATALVSGVVALLLECNPQLSWRDVKEILMRSAQVVDNTDTEWIKNAAGFNFNPLYGAGLVDANAALELAKSWEPLSSDQRSATRSSSNLRLAPLDNDPTGVTQTFSFTESFRMESLTLTWSGTGYTIHDLVFYVTSPSGTTVRMNAVREDDYSTNYIRDLVFSTPYFWGESSAGTWTVKAVDEYLGGNCQISGLGITLYGSSSPQAPANDSFSRATILQTASPKIGVSNRGASREDGEPRHAGVSGGGSLWWNYLALSQGYLTIDTRGSALDTTLAVYRGDALENLQEVASNDNAVTGQTWSRVGPIPVEVGDSLKVAVESAVSRNRGGLAVNFSLDARPLYDRFADGLAQTGNSWTHVWSNAGTGANAYGSETNEPAHASGNPASSSVWYVWRPTATGTATVQTRGSALDTVLAAYQGTQLKGLRQIASNDNEPGLTTSRIVFGVRNGETYYLAVDGKNGATGSYILSASLNGSVPPAPVNDNLTNAVAITGAPLQLEGANLSASGQNGEPTGALRTSVWYLWTAPQSGVVTVSTQGSSFDTTLGAYTGTSLASLTLLPGVPQGSAFNDNVLPGQRWSRIRFNASAGTAYYLRVDGAGGATGRYRLNISY